LTAGATLGKLQTQAADSLCFQFMLRLLHRAAPHLRFLLARRLLNERAAFSMPIFRQ